MVHHYLDATGLGLREIQLDWGSLKKLTLPAASLQHEEVLRPELGTLRGIQAKLVLNSEALPCFRKLRSVPYAIANWSIIKGEI